ncbi:MAG: penicillin acylase family protein, partial [Candidatus Aminicenantales bacterium]
NISYSEWLAGAGRGASNNWVLAGERSETGKPLLANDPHLPISLPPLWYEIHLHCPGLNVIGVSLPGVPLVIIGHNQSIAWGITSSTADVQDLYLEKLDSSQDMYLDSDGWQPLQKREELIKIKGQEKPERMEMGWTSRGPIISPVIVKSEQPISLRWTIYEGGRSFEAFYLLNKAQDWPQFLQALKLFDAPSQNFVYADTKGNIGYYLSGKIPLRPEEAALFPFPGWEEEGKWRGFLKEEDKPTIFNPREGFIVTANNKIIPDDYPFYISFDWDVPFRAERIKELLLRQKKHNLQSLKAIQNDIFSKKAELIVPLLKSITKAKGDLSLALRMIKQWNLKMDQGGAPALYEVFMDFLHAQVFQDELGQDYKKFDTYFRHKKAGLLRILDKPSSPWFDNKETKKIETREDILKLSLDKAYKWLKKKYGPQPNWEWTKIHALRLRHILGQMPFFWFLNAGSHPLNGDAYTVRASFSISSGYKTTHGPSYRQIIDLSNWENSIWIITSGQSGHFLSPFYKDQLPLWLNGNYQPMLFSEKDIRAKTRGVLWLKPLKK